MSQNYLNVVTQLISYCYILINDYFNCHKKGRKNVSHNFGSIIILKKMLKAVLKQQAHIIDNVLLFGFVHEVTNFKMYMLKHFICDEIHLSTHFLYVDIHYLHILFV